tara:strand:- start:89 stop:424 length:336 start_codon:yes stop_codon:yes gene_type:complete
MTDNYFELTYYGISLPAIFVGVLSLLILIYVIKRFLKNVTGNDFEIIMKLVGVTVTVLFVIMLIMQYVKESNCESVTYYEYGEKKTGQVCDDSAKYQLRNNIDETKKRRNK